MTDKVEETILRIVREQFGFYGTQSEAIEQGLARNLGADPLDYVEFATSIELAFKVDCSDEEIRAAETVGGVIRLVRGKLFGDGLHGEGSA